METRVIGEAVVVASENVSAPVINARVAGGRSCYYCGTALHTAAHCTGCGAQH